MKTISLNICFSILSELNQQIFPCFVHNMNEILRVDFFMLLNARQTFLNYDIRHKTFVIAFTHSLFCINSFALFNLLMVCFCCKFHFNFNFVKRLGREKKNWVINPIFPVLFGKEKKIQKIK